MIETIKTAAETLGIGIETIFAEANGNFSVLTTMGDFILVTTTDAVAVAAEMAEQVADRWAVESRSLGDDEE